jgi:hypothetical protein
MPILRIGMGVFLLTWGVDEFAAVSGSQRIFAGFYHITSGPTLVEAAWAAESVVAINARPRALPQNCRVDRARHECCLDDGKLAPDSGPVELVRVRTRRHAPFLASIVIVAVSIVLVLNARESTLTLDSQLRHR